MSADIEKAPDLPTVEVLQGALTADDAQDFDKLLQQLSSTPRTPEEVAHNVQRTLDSPQSRIVVIRDQEGRIKATATGNLCLMPTGQKGWIDDVVTDKSGRGRGYGGLLTGALEEWFTEHGATHAHLTSRPSREEAGSLYAKRGYAERDTRVYRKILPGLGAAATEI